MRTQHQQLKFLLATVAVVLAALVGPMTAGAANDEFIPGVTDSTTGVLRELEERFIPGVTDSTTGVLRELERNRLEHGRGVAHPSAGDSGFEADTTVAVGAALAALVAFAGLALRAAARRRRVAI
jgi:hypothetical protein